MATIIGKKLLDSYNALKGQTSNFLQKNPTPGGYVAGKIAPVASQTFNNFATQAGNFIRPMPSPIPSQGFNRTVEPFRNIVGNTAEAVIRDVPSIVGSMARTAPPVQFGQQIRGVMNPTIQPQLQQQRQQDIYNSAKGYGYATGGAANVVGGIVGMGMGAVGNVLQGKPLTQDYAENFAGGVQTGAAFGPVSKAVGGVLNAAKPLSPKLIKSAINTIQSLDTPIMKFGGVMGHKDLKEIAIRAIARGGREAFEGVATGSIRPLAEGETRAQAITSDVIQSVLMGVAMQAGGDFNEAKLKPILKNAGVSVKQFNYWLQDQGLVGGNQGGYIKFGEDVQNPLRKKVRPGSYTNVPELDNPLVKKQNINPNTIISGEIYDIINKKYRGIQGSLDIDKELMADLPKNLTLEQAIRKLDETGVKYIGGEASAEVAQILKDKGYKYASDVSAVPKIENPLLSKNNDPFVQEMDALAQSRKINTDNIKPKKQVVNDTAIPVPTDADSIESARIRGGAMGKPADDILDSFAGWVNARKATKIEGVVKGREFADLNEKGMQGIFDFQKGDVPGNRIGYDPRFRDLKKYFNDKFETLKKAGVEMNYKKDYLPQLWANTPEEVEKTFRRLGLKPSFTIDSIFKSYQEGIAAGLTPKFNNIGDLATWYESRANKALADRGFFTTLGKNSMILPHSQAPKDWVSLDPDRFPKITVKTDMGVFTGTYKAPPELAEMINNYLRDPQAKGLDKVANIASAIKNRILSAGVPNTGLNAHGFNILARNTLADTNPIRGFIQGANYLLRPKQAEKFLNDNLAKAPIAIKHGLTFDIEDHMFKDLVDDPTSFLGKIDKVRADRYKKWFEDPLFQKALPALKLQHFQQVFDDLKKSFPEDVAGKKAAEITNNIYGGVNWQQWGRSRDTQNLFRAIVLAPDWAEAQLRLGKGVVKGVLDPRNPAGRQYRTIARNMVLAYAAGNITNKLNSGHWMWENEPGNEFNIDTGTYTDDGKKRYIRPFGTAVDFIRIPAEIALGLAKGDPSPVFRAVRNRLSAPIGTAVSLATNTDYLGRSIYGKDKFGNDMGLVKSIGGIAGELSSLVLPTQVRSFIDLATGRNNLEQTVSQAMELPIRYKENYISKSKEPLREIAKSEGLKGESLYNFLGKAKEQAPLGEKQLQKAQMGGTSTLDMIYKKREQTKAINDYKDALKEGETEKAQSIFDKFLKPSASVGAAEKEAPRNDQEIKLYKEAQDEMAKARVELTGTPEKSNDKYYYLNENGNPASIDLKFNPKLPTVTGIKVLDKQSVSTFKSSITSRIKDIGILLEKDVISKEEAVKELNELMKMKNGTSGGNGKKFISDAELLSAYKKAITAAYATPKRTSSSSSVARVNPTITLQRQNIKSLR